MIDPLAQVVSLLQPSVTLSKVVSAAGAWRVDQAGGGQPFYSVVLQGSCYLTVHGHASTLLQAGDFILVPAQCSFSVCSLQAPPDPPGSAALVALADGTRRLGRATGAADIQSLVGHVLFASPDAALLLPLLPRLLHVRGEPRLTRLVQLVSEECLGQRPARDVILARLLDVLLIEALRAAATTDTAPGLLRGLADARLAPALRGMHQHPERAWTVAQLAAEGALSRSAFFERFRRITGIAPMEYLLNWRMALAKDRLRLHGDSIAEVAQRVGYSTPSAFSVAFSRHAGLSPAQYARQQRPAPQRRPARAGGAGRRQIQR